MSKGEFKMRVQRMKECVICRKYQGLTERMVSDDDLRGNAVPVHKTSKAILVICDDCNLLYNNPNWKNL